MFQMFGFGGAACPRCERKNAASDGYCAGCGLTLGAPRNAPVLRENRWIAGPDELAVFFGVRELSGIFVKTLRVPATARAYILQGDKATEVPQGEYEIEGFFTRLNHLLRDQHAEILVTRSGALPVEFSFDDLASCEQLPLSARFTVSLQIGNVPAFARHFMTMPGTIGVAELRELLRAPVRQFALEFVGARAMRDMAANTALRAQLDERLQGALGLLLAQYGLAAVRVDTLELRHDKHDANRERAGSLWLAASERQAGLEHARQLDELYDAEEWQRIRRDEQQVRLRQRRAELTLDEAEQAQARRAREIALYGQVAESESRKQAIERGAGDVLAELEHDLARKGAHRAGEADGWAHVRVLAQLRMRAELALAQQDALQARQLAQQRFSHQLLQQQIRNKIEQALAIEDAGRQRAELARLREAEALAARRARELDDEEHAARRQALVLANTARQREAERALEWQEAVAQGRQRELQRAESLHDEATRQKVEALRRAGDDADALARHERLLRTIEADARHERAVQQVRLDADEQRHAQAIELARFELQRAESFGRLDDAAKLALAPDANAVPLADFLKTRVHATMRADQLAALSGVVAAAHGAPVLPMARRCAHGHAARDGDVFCAACGAALVG
ncbi:hypothetical protein NX773_15670 [Massilia solisilvae]|uniref:Band 7 domain-containing protein n=1 Tax=Massilia solisilvae TaxID=1811225 RepID=A0ABT2BM55_9BURK|nr:hypothetical protein [Massilia solisilvae]MCS0609606.1 hypothetical protein [Massilia solisilvae]